MGAGPWLLPRADLGRLLDALRSDGRRVMGPRVSSGAIVLDEIDGAQDLPTGWRSDQVPGSYRLRMTGDGRVFDYGIGPGSWKQFTYPPRLPLSVATRAADGDVSFTAVTRDPPPLALLGVRACELAALGILGRAVLGDDDERRRREAALTVVVECAVAGGTCFCSSMGTGPGVEEGFDLALTELADDFLLRAGSDAGRAVAARLSLSPAAEEQAAERVAQLAATAESMTTAVAVDGLPERLRAAAESPRWDEIAQRCLSCGACTLLCPTCFCSSVEQRSDLDATESVSERRWDSCFTGSFAAVAGGSFRPRVRDRYRQWLTHKFGTWQQQFGTFGCVGCGRCVTWCPVGIDVREELAMVAPAPIPWPASPAVAAPPALAAPLAAAAPPALAAPPDAAVPATPTAAAAPPAVATTRSATTDLLSLTWPFARARVIWAAPETVDVTTLRLEVADEAIRSGAPGQFVMAALPGFPPSAISISRYHPDGIELTVRGAGPATIALGSLKAGARLGLRGPLGRPWPLELAEGRDVLVVAGGIGLAPLRPVIDAARQQPGRFGRMHICYGAKTPADRLYLADTMQLRRCKCADIAETVDRGDDDWAGRVGLVTCLLDEAEWKMDDLVAFVCGPERMMQVVASTLVDRGVGRDRIWMTMERHMECGVGLCGHCQMGPYFVCRDGPVFSLPELDGLLGVQGI